MTLGIQDIVEVKAEIAPRDAGGREFGRTLLLTTDPTLDAGAGRVGSVPAWTRWLGRSLRAPVPTRPPRSTSLRFPIPGTS